MPEQKFELPGQHSSDPEKNQPAPVKTNIEHMYRDGKLAGISIYLDTRPNIILAYNFNDKTVTTNGTRYTFADFLAASNTLVAAINNSKQDLNPED